jgi:PTH1 family peptidyl-tRNA hydrolase
MWVVAGLGNPGEVYEATRHNVGFAVVERLAARWGVSFGRPRRGSRVARANIRGQRVALVEPLTFMNCSGEALSGLDADLRPALSEVIVVHDDLDLALGRVSIKRGGGSGGHRGLVSIISWAGADLTRVRVGIGRPPLGHDPAGYVLRRFQPEELATAEEAIDRAADAVEMILSDGVERAMNACNRRPAAEERPATTVRRNG